MNEIPVHICTYFVKWEYGMYRNYSSIRFNNSILLLNFSFDKDKLNWVNHYRVEGH